MSKYAPNFSLPALLTLFAIVGAVFAFLGLLGPEVRVYSDVSRTDGMLGLIAATTAVGALHAAGERK